MNLDNKKKIIISVVLVILIVFAFIIYTLIDYSSYNQLDIENEILDQSTQNIVEDVETDAVILNTDEVKEEKIAVHITGAVKKEGIIYLKKGARIVDAIEEAGGATKEADLSQVNLAYELQDGQKIYIPNKNEKISEYITENSGNNVVIEENKSENYKKGGNEKVNINTADEMQLDSLPGIGPALAQRIIEYREENGAFKSIEELQNVKGIGDSKYEDIKNNVTV